MTGAVVMAHRQWRFPQMMCASLQAGSVTARSRCQPPGGQTLEWRLKGASQSYFHSAESTCWNRSGHQILLSGRSMGSLRSEFGKRCTGCVVCSLARAPQSLPTSLSQQLCRQRAYVCISARPVPLLLNAFPCGLCRE